MRKVWNEENGKIKSKKEKKKRKEQMREKIRRGERGYGRRNEDVWVQGLGGEGEGRGK